MPPEGALPSSFRDPAGFVFCRDGVLYRAILGHGGPHYDSAHSLGASPRARRGRPDRPPYGSIFPGCRPGETCTRSSGPRWFPFISYPYEWSFSQLQDAAAGHARDRREGPRHGMTLVDASAYNIQFLRGRPVLIDTLSLRRNVDGRAVDRLPSVLPAFPGPARSDGPEGPPAGPASPRPSRRHPARPCHVAPAGRLAEAARTPASTCISTPAARSGTRGGTPSTARGRVGLQARLGLRRFTAVRDRKLRWRAGGTEWADYYGDTNYSPEGFEDKRAGRRGIHRRHAAPRTVWDLGANAAPSAASLPAAGSLTVSFDIDPACVEINYLRSRRRKGHDPPAPLPGLGQPEPGSGWENAERDRALFERGPADAVLALALVHHLAIGNNVPLGMIARLLRPGRATASSSSSSPSRDSQVARLLVTREDIFDGYSREEFERAFGDRFRRPAPHRPRRIGTDALSHGARDTRARKKAAVLHPFLFSLFPILALYAHNVRSIPIPLKELAGPLASFNHGGGRAASCSFFGRSQGRLPRRASSPRSSCSGSFPMAISPAGSRLGPGGYSTVRSFSPRPSWSASPFISRAVPGGSSTGLIQDVQRCLHGAGPHQRRVGRTDARAAGRTPAGRTRCRATRQCGRAPQHLLHRPRRLHPGRHPQGGLFVRQRAFPVRTRSAGVPDRRRSYANYNLHPSITGVVAEFHLSRPHGPRRRLTPRLTRSRCTAMIRENRAMEFLRSQGYRIVPSLRTSNPGTSRTWTVTSASTGRRPEFRSVAPRHDSVAPCSSNPAERRVAYERPPEPHPRCVRGPRGIGRRKGPVLLFRPHHGAPSSVRLRPERRGRGPRLPVFHGRRRQAPRRGTNGMRDYIIRYRDQLEFLNTKLLRRSTPSWSAPAPAPIVVLQGDHGSRAYADFDRPEVLVFQGKPGHPQRLSSSRDLPRYAFIPRSLP